MDWGRKRRSHSSPQANRSLVVARISPVVGDAKMDGVGLAMGKCRRFGFHAADLAMHVVAQAHDDIGRGLCELVHVDVNDLVGDAFPINGLDRAERLWGRVAGIGRCSLLGKAGKRLTLLRTL